MKLPIIIEDSSIPKLVSFFIRAKCTAVSFAIFIIFRDKIEETIWRHEMIHYRQQKELFFVGQWLRYVYYYVSGIIKYRDRNKAYMENPFEKEAYANQEDPTYLVKRRMFAWKKYIGD